MMQHIKVRKLYGIFYRNYAHIRDMAAYKAIYNSYIQSRIDYGIAIWGMAAPTTLLPLVAIHKKFLKMNLKIPVSNHSYTYTQLARLVGTATIHTRYIYKAASLLYDHIHYDILDDNYKIYPTQRVYRTRNQPKYIVPYTKLSCRLRSIAFIFPRLLNEYQDLDPYTQTKTHFMKTLLEVIPKYYPVI